MTHLVIMAAGTGGHVIPGLAVAREVQRRGWTVSWLGTTTGMENRLVPPAGIALDRLGFTGLRGKGLLHALTGGARLLKAFWDCLAILRRRGADAVLGMGGYVCFPGGMMAALLGKPLMLVNADATLLLSNKALLPVADRVAFGFPGPAAEGTKRSVVTGNPVRTEIEALPAPELRLAGRDGPLELLVIGGSLGARVLNETVPAALALISAERRPRVTHQSGAAHLDAVRTAYREAGVQAQVLPFIDDMAERLGRCDLALCRAGAITVSELCAGGVASVLAEAGVDPTFVIGGKLESAGANSRLGSGEYIVVEADESDASFLNLSPVLAVVTNIDADHMDTYGHDFARLKAAFVDFLHRMPFYGAAVLCDDDPGVRSIVPMVSRPIVSYGFGPDAQVRAVDVRALPGGQMRFTCQRRNGEKLPDLEVTLNLPGEHNVRNALAAIAVATEIELPDPPIVRALSAFSGVARRFQRHGDLLAAGGGEFTLIDDYGHHPVEMAAVIAAARGAFPGRRLVLAFQPHRYTRTRDCFEDFVKVMAQADAVLLTEVYPAGESPIVAADGRALARALRVAGRVDPVFVDEVAALPQAIVDFARGGDVVIAMGAGSIGAVPGQVVELVRGARR